MYKENIILQFSIDILPNRVILAQWHTYHNNYKENRVPIIQTLQASLRNNTA